LRAAGAPSRVGSFVGIVLVLELESEIGPVRSAISGTAQTPPFDYENEFEDDYELLWRL
jgi:hypothetical protein